MPADRPDTLRRLATEIGSMADQGLFAERLGLWCPDAHDQPAPEDLFADILGRRIDEFSWPPSESLLLAWDDDDVFDVLEVLHHVASWPAIWHGHDFGGCPGHPSSYSAPLGQALYRWRLNQILDDSKLSVRLSDSGEDLGQIVKSVNDSTSAAIDTAMAAPLGDDATTILHAIATFRGRHRTPETLRNAIVDLAGVLERHRELVKATFTRKDEAALFEIANKFDLRHRDAGQRGDYDLDFFEWLFQWYLATVTLVVRRLDQQSPLTSAAKQ